MVPSLPRQAFSRGVFFGEYLGEIVKGRLPGSDYATDLKDRPWVIDAANKGKPRNACMPGSLTIW